MQIFLLYLSDIFNLESCLFYLEHDQALYQSFFKENKSENKF